MATLDDLEKMSLKFPRSLLIDKFVEDYLPFVQANMRAPVVGIDYYSFRTVGVFEENGKRYEEVKDLEVKVRTKQQSMYFKFQQNSHIGEDEDTGRDLWAISGYNAMTIAGEDFDELSDDEKQILDIFKETSLQFFQKG